MLSATRLSSKDPGKHLKTTNDACALSQELPVSLQNGPKAFVATGPARTLYGLVVNIHYNAAAFRVTVSETQQKTPAGVGITLTCS